MQGPSLAPDQLPQPPDQQQIQQQQVPGGPTLGDVNQAAAPGNPVTAQYADAIQGMLGQLQPFMEHPTPPPPPKPIGIRLLEGLGTFGISELKHIADENTRREENYRILQRNRQIGLKGVDLAVKATDAQATAAGLAARQGIAMQQLTLAQQKFINDLIEQKKTEARANVNQEFKFNTIPVPLGPDAEDSARAKGYGPDPTGRFGGHWVLLSSLGGGAAGGGGTPNLTRNPATGAWELPKPGTAARTALDAVGGGDTGGAGDLAQRPGESTPDWIRRKKGQFAASTKTATENATQNAELDRNAKLVESQLSDPKLLAAIKANLLPGMISGALGTTNMMVRRKAGAPGTAKLGLLRSDILPALRALEGGTKGTTLRGGKTMEQLGLTKQFEGLVNGNMSQQEAEQFIPELLGRLKEIRSTFGAPPQQLGGGTQPDAGTTTTPGQLGTSRRLSSGKLIFEQP